MELFRRCRVLGVGIACVRGSPVKRGGDIGQVSAVSPGIVAPRDYSRIFLGQSELALRMRRFDWAQTSIGSPGTWPQSLKTAVGIMLTSQQLI